MNVEDSTSHQPDDPADAKACQEALEWLSARAIELVGFPPEADLYDYVCTNVRELVGNAIVGVNSIDLENGVLRVRRLAGIDRTRLYRVEKMLERKVVGATFRGVQDEVKRQLETGSLVEVTGGVHEMFFGRVPRPVCLALEKFLGVKSIHSIGLRRNKRLMGNVTIIALEGASLNKHVIEAFVNQASAALDRQQSELNVRQANANLDIIARNVTDVVWMAEFRGVKDLSPEVVAELKLDAESLFDRWQFTFVSPSSAQILRYPAEKLRSLSLRDLITARAWVEVRERFAEDLAGALADPGWDQPIHPMEVEYIDGEGQPRWCETTARFLRNDQADIVGILGVTRDVDERRQETEALREERNRLGQLLEMHERDRSLVAYEIHDGLVQSMVAALMFLDEHLRLLDREGSTAKALDRAQTSKESLTKAIADARRLMGGLRPAALDQCGIISAIEELVAERQAASGPSIELDHDVRFDRLAAPFEMAVFRVVQEALLNAVRHSQSSSVHVSLVQSDDHLKIEVIDHGIGFDQSDVSRDRFGLEGIRHRVRIFKGHTQIDSRPGHGTRVTVTFPLPSGTAK